MGDADGFATEALVPWTRELAEGGVGLIVLIVLGYTYTFVAPDGRQHVARNGPFSDDHIPRMRRITRPYLPKTRRSTDI